MPSIAYTHTRNVPIKMLNILERSVYIFQDFDLDSFIIARYLLALPPVPIN